jgi:hypothetical protein
VFGNGVAIWSRQKQFRLNRDQLRAQLEAFVELDFANLRESYGGKGDPDTAEGQAPRATCRIRLALDGVAKQVVQLQGGRQSRQLKELAHRILDSCREPARAGVTAADLNDGLAKIERGELASEALHVLAHRKVDRRISGGVEGSWILRVDGPAASTTLYKAEGGYTEPIVLKLAQEDLAKLALSLKDRAVGDLPGNLYAEHYTDFVVQVLKHEKRIQARPFAGMTAATHGEMQPRFDEIFRALQQLHQRVLQEGARETEQGSHGFGR